MTNPNAKTLQIFLPTGEPRGIRIAELTTRIVQSVLIPRSDLAMAKARPELDHLSVYFLFGDSEEAAKPIVYVGQTEDVRKRLDYHNSTKDFWQTAVLVISKTHSFTQAHIKYLEYYCVKKAKEIGRYALNNDQIPSKPFVPEPMEADLLDGFETLATLLATLGYPVFEPIIKNDAAEQFYLKGKDSEAVGELVEDGFVVRAGAIARIEVVPSAQDTVPSMRKKLVESGVLVQEDGHLRFTQDYLFNTPSGAAAVVLGRTSNGWVDWKNGDGETLNEVKRAESVEE
ncbi:MAG: GIY-YIG nuclease family protein [Pirellulaceae bacterium]